MDWGTIDDKDDDLFVDAPGSVLEGVSVTADEYVAPEDVMAFYADEAANSLRRTACRFRSEWGQDIPRMLERFEELDLSTGNFETYATPFQFWSAVSDVVPEDPHVWHYNPIEFLAEYQRIVETFKVPETSDTEGHLAVTVVASNGMAPKQRVIVEVHQSGKIVQNTDTNAEGQAFFSNLPIGSYELRISSEEGSSAQAVVISNKTAEVRLETQTEGKAIPHGPLTVVVRTAWGTTGSGALVVLSGEKLEGGAASKKVGGSSSVVFEALPAGTYTVFVQYPDDPEAPAADCVETEEALTFDGKRKTMPIRLPPAKTELRIVSTSETPYQPGNILRDKQPPLPFITNEEGVAEVTVERGQLKIQLGTRNKSVKASQAKMTVRL